MKELKSFLFDKKQTLNKELTDYRDYIIKELDKLDFVLKHPLLEKFGVTIHNQVSFKKEKHCAFQLTLKPKETKFSKHCGFSISINQEGLEAKISSFTVSEDILERLYMYDTHKFVDHFVSDLLYTLKDTFNCFTWDDIIDIKEKLAELDEEECSNENEPT